MRHAGQAADAWIFGAKTESRPSLMLWINFVIDASRVVVRNRVAEEAYGRFSSIWRRLRVAGDNPLPVLHPYQVREDRRGGLMPYFSITKRQNSGTATEAGLSMEPL